MAAGRREVTHSCLTGHFLQFTVKKKKKLRAIYHDTVKPSPFKFHFFCLMVFSIFWKYK